MSSPLFNHWQSNFVGNIKKTTDEITYDFFIDDMSYSSMKILMK